ncbi:uncharacterized protein LOC109927663 isoform X2 [Rhincodon typus]|uniref:uncharacterized protein LOC109927663 isoform X2 n=1 Tax=Rhincodon typus TaxID=259920 RepID=UPI00202E7AC4|nr:uncharacterized protein LOC109927663 isoform X2 [Rhincodon typus]
MYTLYRSVTDHSELELICEVDSVLIETKWTWSSPLKTQDKEIASSYKSKPVNINNTCFGSRLVRPVTSFTDRFFSMRIVPVQFEDAGVYRCSQGSDKHLTINLVTVKAELSDEETEGDSVPLTCSVSHVTESMRLVWINSDGKIVAEKTFKEQKQKEDNLQLIIQKFDRDRMNWTCILFHQNTPKVLIPYYLKFTKPYTVQPTDAIVFGSLALLIIILVIILTLRRCRRAGKQGSESQRSKPVQRRENREDAFQLYSNINEIQQMQDTESPVLETSSFPEYAIVNRKAKANNAEREDIHYGSINFHKTATGSKQGTERTQRNKQPSVVELGASNENDSSIYAQIAQVRDQ